MGLYLCVFADEATDEELEGVEVGGYDDFDLLRRAAADRLEPAGWGSRFPVLMSHPDSDGTWSPQEASRLEAELLTIAGEFARLPPVAFPSGWQETVAKQLGLQPVSLLRPGRRPELAPCDPTACLRPRPQPRRRRLVPRQTQPGQPRRDRRGPSRHRGTQPTL
jgi:hypothetical protein